MPRTRRRTQRTRKGRKSVRRNRKITRTRGKRAKRSRRRRKVGGSGSGDKVGTISFYDKDGEIFGTIDWGNRLSRIDDYKSCIYYVQKLVNRNIFGKHEYEEREFCIIYNHSEQKQQVISLKRKVGEHMSIEIDNLKAWGLNLKVFDSIVTGGRGYLFRDLIGVYYLFNDNEDALKFVAVINKLREDSATVIQKPLPQLTRTIDREGWHTFGEEVSFRLRMGHYHDVHKSIQCGKYTLSYTRVEKRNVGERIKKYLLELTCEEDNEKYYLFHRTCDKEIYETSIIDVLPSGEYPTNVEKKPEGIQLQCNANTRGRENYGIYHIPGITGMDLFVNIEYMVKVFLKKVSDLKEEVDKFKKTVE